MNQKHGPAIVEAVGRKNAFDLGRLPHERRFTLKDLLKYFTAPLALTLAFAVVGAPSAPATDIMRSAGDAHACWGAIWRDCSSIPDPDSDGDGKPDSQDLCPTDPTDQCGNLCLGPDRFLGTVSLTFSAVALASTFVPPAAILFGTIAVGLAIADAVYGQDGDTCGNTRW